MSNLRLPIDRVRSMSAVDRAVADVQAYAGVQAIEDVAMLLDALVEHYRVLLGTVTPEGLHTLQGALSQCIALRAALAKDGQRPIVSPPAFLTPDSRQ